MTEHKMNKVGLAAVLDGTSLFIAFAVYRAQLEFFLNALSLRPQAATLINCSMQFCSCSIMLHNQQFC